MNYLSVENLSLHFGDRLLFENLSFGLDKGDKTALIARNGTGKTSLFNILTGRDVPNSGRVVFREGIRVGYLEQNPLPDENLTIEQIISTANSHTLTIIKQYEAALQNQADNFSDGNRRETELLSHKMDELQAWDYERRLTQILTRLQITDFQQTVSELSGGQRKRLALALVLIDSPDILLLDEPTNHMDIDMIEWLEDYLSDPSMTILMVTHDRYFLDKVCGNILEMENGSLYQHAGNYAYYLEKSEQRKASQDTEYEKTRRQYKKELEWMRTQPRARTHKSKSRIESFYELERKTKSKVVHEELKIDMKMNRLGGKIMELINIEKHFGDLKVLNPFSYTFKRGDRIGIVGSNGAGKTTFLNIITGQLLHDAGKIIPGDTIRFGYFKQEGLITDETKKVIDVVKDIAEDIIMADGRRITASQFLNSFQFPPSMQNQFVSKLSGGEKRRLYLLTILIKNPNFLILDEPTNDLDLPTLQSLEQFLNHFGGCLILVSHDRYFLDTLTEHLFIFKGNGDIKDYYDTYTAYREEYPRLKKPDSDPSKSQLSTKPVLNQSTEITPIKRKPTWKEKNEFQQLEREIEALESEKLQLEHDIQNAGGDPDTIMSLSIRYAEIKSLLDDKSMRWLELAEIVVSN